MIEKGRFAFADAKGKPCTVSAFESWLRELRTRFPNRKIVGIGDNFHLYEDFASTEGENRLRRISKAAKRLTTTYDITLLCPMEVPGTILRKGVRPDMKSIKGSTGPQYDANLNIGVYNDFQDFGAHANLFWDDEKDKEKRISVAGADQEFPKRKPIIELVIDKNKVNGNKGYLYLKFWPDKSYLEECSKQDHVRYSQAAEAHPGQGYQQLAGHFWGRPRVLVFEFAGVFGTGVPAVSAIQRSFRKTARIVCRLTPNCCAKSAVVYISVAATRRIRFAFSKLSLAVGCRSRALLLQAALRFLCMSAALSLAVPRNKCPGLQQRRLSQQWHTNSLSGSAP